MAGLTQIHKPGAQRDQSYPRQAEVIVLPLHERVNLAFPSHPVDSTPRPRTESGRRRGSLSLAGGRSATPSAARSGAGMAAPESAPAALPGAAEGEEETILYDLLVNTEWPPETEVQVTQAPLGLRPARRRRCPGGAT